jgi:DNA repair exonuclease SbcCD ATPase subunit
MRPIQSTLPAAGAGREGSGGGSHKRTVSGGSVRSINSIVRDLVQEADKKTQQQHPVLLTATRSASWDVQTSVSVKNNTAKGPSLSELQELKRDLKNQLKQYDIHFARTHGRMPNKAEKEVIRPLYNHYNALKDYIGPVESLKKKLKQYDMHFAQTHGRMPTKAEKAAVRHLYEKYKALKAEIATYLLDYEQQQQTNKATTTTLLFGDQRVNGSVALRLFDKLHSFDSDLTPDDIEIGEL